MLHRLAWYQLITEKRRLLAAIAGISFAVLLELTQLGFRDALFTSAALIHSKLHADLVLVSPHYEYVLSTGTITRRRLYEALGVPAVASVSSVYLGLAPLKNTVTGEDRRILVIGLNPDEQILEVPSLNANLWRVKVQDVAIFDALSRPDFGPIVEQFRRDGTVTTEIAGVRTRIGGLFELGASFAAIGTIVMNDTSFRRRFSRPEGIMEFGLIRLKPGSDVAAAQSQLESRLPHDVRVLTRQQFIDLELSYWDRNTPIGFVFFMGELIGFLVGAVIVYQILYADVSDHLTEYATLKAMGYTDLQLYVVVLEEAVMLSIFSFPFGFGLSQLLYMQARDSTHLPIFMTAQRAIFVLLLTMVMCAGAGLLVTQRLRAADPAEVFS